MKNIDHEYSPEKHYRSKFWYEVKIALFRFFLFLCTTGFVGYLLYRFFL